jgi:hypothetical protein
LPSYLAGKLYRNGAAVGADALYTLFHPIGLLYHKLSLVSNPFALDIPRRPYRGFLNQQISLHGNPCEPRAIEYDWGNSTPAGEICQRISTDVAGMIICGEPGVRAALKDHPGRKLSLLQRDTKLASKVRLDARVDQLTGPRYWSSQFKVSLMSWLRGMLWLVS